MIGILARVRRWLGRPEPRAIGTVEKVVETPEGVEIRGHLEPTFIPERYGQRYSGPHRAHDVADLPERREKQCRYSWWSGMYGYVRCEHDTHYSSRHGAKDPRTWVMVGAELSAPGGSWYR